MTARPAAEDVLTVDVPLGANSYQILIGSGLMAQAGERLTERHPGARALIVTDQSVGALHLATLQRSLARAGIIADAIEVPPGEASKSFAELARVTGAVLSARLERDDLVIALGGGVVGDLAGFAAAIARRGMPYVQIPTSLLAQVDSSVGGKTGINTEQGKNLAGAFHQPSLVIIDTATLRTLPRRELRAGYAEVVKYGLIGDRPLFDWLERRREEVLSLGPSLSEAIAFCCAAKARVVAADERERGQRALLNLGHTFGHAFEAVAGYDGRVVHGEAVALGTALAFRLSRRLGLCPADDVVRVERHLEAAGLPTQIRDLPPIGCTRDALYGAMLQDKKVKRGAITLILVRGIGQAFVAHDIDTAMLLDFLEDELTS